jgi:hypothetical protein
VFEFLALLRSHVSLQKDFAGIFGLSPELDWRNEERKTGEYDQTDFLHA